MRNVCAQLNCILSCAEHALTAVDSFSLEEAKKVFILVPFCIIERKEASDTASFKSSRRVLGNRASLFAWKLAIPTSKMPFFGRRLRGKTHLENTGFRIDVYAVNFNLPTSVTTFSAHTHTHNKPAKQAIHTSRLSAILA